MCRILFSGYFRFKCVLPLFIIIFFCNKCQSEKYQSHRKEKESEAYTQSNYNLVKYVTTLYFF